MDLGELLREALARDPRPHAAQLPDAARDHHRRGHPRRASSRSSPASTRYVRDKVIQLAPDVFVRHQVRDHPQPRGVPGRAQAPRTSTGTTTSACASTLHAGRRGGGRGRGPARRSSAGDRRLADIQVHGTTANYGALLRLDIEAGRYFTDGRGRRPAQAVAVIGWDVKDELFPQLDPIGRDDPRRRRALPRHRRCWRKQGRDARAEPDNQVFVPIQAYRRTFGNRDSLNILVKARGGVAGVERLGRRGARGDARAAPHRLPRPRSVRHRHRREPAGRCGGRSRPPPSSCRC